MTSPDAGRRIGVVAIGRNEGRRLIDCLKSVGHPAVDAVVYVDSGSTDGSAAAAKSLGAEVVALDMSVPFTAARARNAGLARLIAIADPGFVQFIDGDCVMAPGWLDHALDFLAAHGDVAAACGRRREKFPDASLYNRLCDIEWATPIGEALACGGDALMRVAPVTAAGGYDETLIAGEEPELCLRLREQGWRIWRLDAEMTGHDAAMTRFSQWWKRARRAGYAYAEISTIHRGSPKAIWRRETVRALGWAGLAPLALLLALLVSPWFALLLAVYPAQALRIYARARRRLGRDAAPFAALSVIGKFPEAAGALTYFANRLTRRRAGLIEYK